MANVLTQCSTVYGPVTSWRYGRSLGIDPIGSVSSCSFDCVYCQLGEIEQKTDHRQIFVPTCQIQRDLDNFAPWDVDVITLSGSGEPTLAQNLGEILSYVQTRTQKTVGVLTNATLLIDPQVRTELAIADFVSVKIDAVSMDQLRRVNRPVHSVHLAHLWEGLQQFRQQYTHTLAIQTMLLTEWDATQQDAYIALMQTFKPDEIQLNTPSRPKPFTHSLTARGNHDPHPTADSGRVLKPVDQAVLRAFSDRIHQATGIPVRYPQLQTHVA